MAALSVGKLLICELCQGVVSWRGGPDIKVYIFGVWVVWMIQGTG